MRIAGAPTRKNTTRSTSGTHQSKPVLSILKRLVAGDVVADQDRVGPYRPSELVSSAAQVMLRHQPFNGWSLTKDVVSEHLAADLLPPDVPDL